MMSTVSDIYWTCLNGLIFQQWMIMNSCTQRIMKTPLFFDAVDMTHENVTQRQEEEECEPVEGTSNKFFCELLKSCVCYSICLICNGLSTFELSRVFRMRLTSQSQFTWTQKKSICDVWKKEVMPFAMLFWQWHVNYINQL